MNVIKKKLILTRLSAVGSPPVSISKIFHMSTSERRFATTDPADPAPTTIKSYSLKPFHKSFVENRIKK